jgi:hypothetical protein
VVFVDSTVTSDFQTTSGLNAILDNDGNVDDIDGFLQERTSRSTTSVVRRLRNASSTNDPTSAA